MTRRQRNYLPHLLAEWQRMFPGRPPKQDFSDEVLCAVNFLMRQLDYRTGEKHAINEPPMPAEGYVPQSSVRSKRQAEVEE